MYRGGGVKNKIGGGDVKKKSQSALFSSLGRWTGNNLLFEDGLRKDSIV